MVFLNSNLPPNAYKPFSSFFDHLISRSYFLISCTHYIPCNHIPATHVSRFRRTLSHALGQPHLLSDAVGGTVGYSMANSAQRIPNGEFFSRFWSRFLALFFHCNPPILSFSLGAAQRKKPPLGNGKPVPKWKAGGGGDTGGRHNGGNWGRELFHNVPYSPGTGILIFSYSNVFHRFI